MGTSEMVSSVLDSISLRQSPTLSAKTSVSSGSTDSSSGSGSSSSTGSVSSAGSVSSSSVGSGAGSSSALSPLSAGGRRGSGPHAVSDRAAPATNVPKAIRPDSMRRVSDNMETPLDRLQTSRANPGLSKQMHTALGRFHLSRGQGGE